MHLEGGVQKGPFILGTSISVNVLDAAANPTGDVYTTQTENDLGEFSTILPTNAPVLIAGTGFYFSEITGELSGANLTLRAYYDPSTANQQQAFVNILTHLVSARVKKLVGDGASYADAISQAEAELVTALGVGPAGLVLQDGFVGADIMGEDNIEHAYGLAISVLAMYTVMQRILSTAATFDAEFQQFLNQIEADLSADGVLNGLASGVPQEFADMQWKVDYRHIDRVMRHRIDEVSPGRDFEANPLPNLHRILDSDGDGVINIDDNCVRTANTDQLDADTDGVGDACDFHFKAISLGTTYLLPDSDGMTFSMSACGIHAAGGAEPAGTVSCWKIRDGMPSPFHRVPAMTHYATPTNVSFVEVGSDSSARAISSSQLYILGGGLDPQIPSASTVSVRTHTRCGTGVGFQGTPYGNVTCAGTDLGNGPQVITGSFKAVVNFGHDSCTLATTNSLLQCWNINTVQGINERPWFSGEDPSTPLDQIVGANTFHNYVSTGGTACGIRAATASSPGEIGCWHMDDTKNYNLVFFQDVMPGTQFEKIAWGGQLCGIESSAAIIRCNNLFQEPTTGGAIFAPPGTHEDISANDSAVCGIRTDGRLDCSRAVLDPLTRPWDLGWY